MSGELISRASDASDSVRAFPWPVLEPGNGSFPEGEYGLEEAKSSKGALEITHHLAGAPLIERLLQEGKAKYACVVSSPVSSYRELHLSPIKTHTIEWKRDDLGEPPLFTPMILCARECTLSLDSAADGVSAAWDGMDVRITEGARLAIGTVFRLKSSLLQLLSFREDPELPSGTFYAETSSEGGFSFVVYTSSDLLKQIQIRSGPSYELRRRFMTNAVTACFALLQRDYIERGKDAEEDEISQDRNLELLMEHLEREGLGNWTDENFRPEEAASKLYPYHMLQEEDDDD